MEEKHFKNPFEYNFLKDEPNFKNGNFSIQH